MKYENDGFDPTPYDRILGGIHTPAREPGSAMTEGNAQTATETQAAQHEELERAPQTTETPETIDMSVAERKWQEDLAKVAESADAAEAETRNRETESQNAEAAGSTADAKDFPTEVQQTGLDAEEARSSDAATAAKAESETENPDDDGYERVSLIGDVTAIPTPERLVFLEGSVLFTTLEFTDTNDEKPIRITVEEDILVPDIKPDMASILSMDGKIRCVEREIKTGTKSEETLNISGDITLKTVYIPEKDTAEPVVTIQSRVPLKADWRTHVPPLASLSVKPVIEKIEYSVINERKFRAKITVLLTMREYIKKSLDFFEGIEGEEVQLLKEKITFTDVAARKTDVIDMDEEIILKEGMPEPEQILKYDIRTVENHKQITSEKAVINGSVYYSILYLAKQETEEGDSSESIPFMYQGKTEFTQFIALNGAGAQAGSRITFDDSELGIKIKTAGTSPDYDDDEDATYERTDSRATDIGTPAFVLEGNINTTVEIYRNIESEVATDAYHNEKELAYDSEEFTCGALEGNGVVEVSVREILNVPAEYGEIERVIYVSGKISDAENAVEYGKETVSGKLEVEMLALPADKNAKPFKMTQTIPFRGSMDIISARNGMLAESDLYIKELRCDKINNKQIEVNAGIFASGTVYSREVQRLIKNPAFIEAVESSEKKPGMILYITKPQDNLWSIAKKFRTTMEKISRVNGLDEGAGIADGTKLLIVK